MRVCDRHPRTEATGRVILEREDSHFDLCDVCLVEIQKYISDPKSKIESPKERNLAVAK